MQDGAVGSADVCSSATKQPRVVQRIAWSLIPHSRCHYCDMLANC